MKTFFPVCSETVETRYLEVIAICIMLIRVKLLVGIMSDRAQQDSTLSSSHFIVSRVLMLYLLQEAPFALRSHSSPARIASSCRRRSVTSERASPKFKMFHKRI